MEFSILGSLEITVGAQRLEPGGTRQQIVLATLLLSANEVVTVDRLLEAIYGADMPSTSRSQLQISISSLRRLFAAHCHQDEVITTHPQGYIISVDRGQLDSQQFEELAAAGRAACDAGQSEQAVASYRDALRLWRGPALNGLDSQLVQASASRLNEQRISVNEERIHLELELGRHHELVGELAELVEEYPLRERLRGQLMVALHRCDRTAEALQVYRQTRQTMIDELGIEPSEQLQWLERAILNSDPVLKPSHATWRRPAASQVPNLVPADIADFTGRTGQIESIRRHLIGMAGAEATALAVPILVISGRGGIGKTSLAVHVAHALAADFPDGQLFADLHGGAAHPVSPMQVLERFLRAFGLPSSQIPDSLDTRAEVYRSLLADRRVLVVLDDAAAERHVAPLIPGSAGTAVVVTSQSRLAGLAGASHIELEVFDADKSFDLLARIVGSERVLAQRTEAAAVAEHCGHLPLALRIAGARLAARPHWSIRQLVDRLADETHRLDELTHDDMGVRPSIWFSYDSATPEARRLFRLLALLDVPAFSGWLCGALLGRPLRRAEDLLDDLVSAHLVETTGTGAGVHGQYRLHELVRVFARERLAAEQPTAEREAALERALGALLFLAEEAHRRYYGGDYVRIPSDAPRWPLPRRLVDVLVSDPLAWYDRERATLVAGVRLAAQAGFADICWSLALSAVTLFETRVYLDDWAETHAVALECTRNAGHTLGQATMLYSLGSLHLEQQRFGSARQEFAEAARLFTEAGSDQGVGLVTRHIAYMNRLNGRLADAAAQYEQVLAIFSRTGDKVAAAYVLQNLAQVRLELNETVTARDLLTHALQLSRNAGCARVEAQVLQRMGETALLAGEPASACGTFELALARITEVGDPTGEAYVLQGLGVARARMGDFGSARDALRRALTLARSVGERLAEARALTGLGELALASGDPAQAEVLVLQASEIFQAIGAPLYQAQARTLLNRTQAFSGTAPDEAAATAGHLGGPPAWQRPALPPAR